MKSIHSILGLLVLSFTLNAHASFQLVQTIPVETTLQSYGTADTQAVWLDMIRSATSRIDIEQFYLVTEAGEPLEAVLDELKKAADRGVKIRIVVSNRLIKEYQSTLDRLLTFRGLEARILDLSEHTGGIQHAKFWIIDGLDGYVGSANFDWRALSQIHELGLRVRDPKILHALQSVFDFDWAIAGGEQPTRPALPENKGPATESELVASPAVLNPLGMRTSEEALVELIRSARKSLNIQLLDYSTRKHYSREQLPPYTVLDDALRDAARRGVQIKLLVSHWNLKQPGLDDLRKLQKTRGIEIRVATVPPNSRGEIPFARVIHSKYMTVDSRTLVIGTSNWSRDYFERSRNLELILKDTAITGQAERIFQGIWDAKWTSSLSER